MVINQLYKKYFQKSKIFMYPLLGIERGNIVPEQTYTSMKDNFTSEARKLILKYNPNEHEGFNIFKTERLLKHRFFENHFEDENQMEVFVFNLSSYASDWDLFLDGKYSQISIESKRKILNFFEKNSGNYIYLHSYLFPKKWFSKYAELLDVKESLLLEVGELLDKPNLSKEDFQYIPILKVAPIIKNQECKQVSSPCPRCNGTGRLPQYNHIQNGVCFKCSGAQVIKRLLVA